jgi:chaperonin cofactor prefoldin
MTATSNIEIEELKNFINEKFNEFKLELKQDINQLDKKIDVLSEKVSGIDKRISIVETSIQKIPDLAEKVG